MTQEKLNNQTNLNLQRNCQVKKHNILKLFFYNSKYKKIFGANYEKFSIFSINFNFKF
jgi:hypothetical protein